MITITNDEHPQLIKSTNFWTTDYAKQGFCFLSWNAGAGRLLMPESTKNFLKEMRAANHVVVSRGFWPEAGEDGIELLFEDYSSEPFCLHLTGRQTDRKLPASDQGGPFRFFVWAKDGLTFEFPAFYRKVKRVPYLKPWGQ